MVEESSPLLPPAEESIEAETDTALEPEPESGEPASEPASDAAFVCDCEKEWMRSACKGLPFYKEHESRRYCVLHYPGKEKIADFKAALENKLNKNDFDFQHVWFPDAVDFQGFEFSAAANFSSATFSAEAYFFSATFSAEAYFGNATFSAGAYFSSATFSARADFDYATFNGEAHFISATFCAAVHFGNATFSAEGSFILSTFSAVAYFPFAVFGTRADFSFAKFSARADFSSATFSALADFKSATFSAPADFSLSVFHGRADFSHASFNDSIHFFGTATSRVLKDGTNLAATSFGKNPSLDSQHVRIEHPERIAFHTLSLRPHWFVNVDSRQFVFTDVGWEWEHISVKQEIAALEANEVSSPNRLLAITCRQLAENAEANNRYEEASRFRYWAMDLARRMKWKGWAFWKTDWVHMLYWAVSGYGERRFRALGALAAVWIVFVLFYTQVGFEQKPPKVSNDSAQSVTAASMTIEDRIGQPLEFSRALTYSLGVMSLQKPEPKPLTGTAQTLVLLETILGPVQAALLALAIRRKFMR
jgi:hypothetical protein